MMDEDCTHILVYMNGGFKEYVDGVRPTTNAALEKHVTMAKIIKGVEHHACTVPECSVVWADAPVEEME